MHTRQYTAFVQHRLPWLIAIAAFILYLLTLNRWVSLSTLSTVANILDPNSSPPFHAPLHFLLVLPLRWLPHGAQLFALNLIAVTCATLTLTLLARSVALLPHDRTRDQRHRERSDLSLLSIPSAWLPPIFATTVLGLHLAFWEHATAGTGAMLDLLLFAYLVRCLLEFRIDERESWLTRLALVYGIATANNYAMIAWLPAFLIAIIWIRGRDFFNFRFILRMAAWGLAGLSLYLLLPAIIALSPNSDVGFWQALRTTLIIQKQALFSIPRYIVLFGALTSILPILFIGIRWPSSFGDTSAAGTMLTNFMFRIVHALFLVACVWVAFDAPFNPRILFDRLVRDFAEIPVSLPFLGFQYLGALAIGYLIGYFLLLSRAPEERSWRKSSPLAQTANTATFAIICIAAVAVPALLAYRNLPVIRANDGSLLRDYAHLAAISLPPTNTVVLADNSLQHLLLQTWLRQKNPDQPHLVVDTRLLPYPAYHNSLSKRFPDQWPEAPNTDSPVARLSPVYLLYLIGEIASSNSTHYLNPSFGYYFEPLYLQPQGLSYSLHPYPTNQIFPPPLSTALVQTNLAFWQSIDPILQRLSPLVDQRIADARLVGSWYSRALVYWGVELQRSGRLEEAARCFSNALRLNPDNLVAQINLQYNQSVQHGAPKRVQLGKKAEEQFGPMFRSWDALLAANGPVDEPGFCFRVGQLMTQQSLLRQAAFQFSRTIQLEPDNLSARFWLGSVYLTGGLPQKALDTATDIRAHSPNLDQQVELARLEAMARFALGEREAAETILRRARQQFPNADRIFDAQAELYLSSGQLTNALNVIEEQLQANPNNLRALIHKATIAIKTSDYDQAQSALDNALRLDPQNVQALLTQSALSIQTQRFTRAIDAVNRVLESDPHNQAALMNRAIALLQNGQLDEAHQDYLLLHKRLPQLYTVHFGLGEIAWRRKDSAEAIKFFELYLKHAPPDTDEAKRVAERLNQLKR